jgi:solute carrier family 12 (sodium/potassium/chloride transporter), member 2
MLENIKNIFWKKKATEDLTLSPSETTVNNKFGTFKGVFTPSLLTILGVIMYMRFGWVLGNVGLWQTILIVLLSCSITFLTALSIAALATNMKVGGGGAYYIISRSLGVEAGAAIGLPLFLAQALGVAFYIAGFSESLVSLFPGLSPQLIGAIVLLGLTTVAYLSANIALKAQFVILLIIIASLISLFMGSGEHLTFAEATFIPEKNSFWTVFAVFFPAVTGIEAGLALSGELKKPERSLPIGTLSAVLVSTAVYVAIPIFLAQTVKHHELFLTSFLIMREIATFGPLIIAGLWGATLSSALGAILGSSRTLQALAKDRIVFSFLGKGYGVTEEPRLATAATAIIALIGILMGDLNVIAPVLSMFFLTSYGLLNISSSFEGIIGNPSWRPTFKVPWYLSFLGFLGCLCVMLMINAGATIIAFLASIMVYYWVKRRGLKAHWGDMRFGILSLITQLTLYKLALSKPDEKTWRPNIMVLSGSPSSRWHLIALADAVSHGKGFLTVASIVPEQVKTGERETKLESTVREHLQTKGVPSMVKIFSAPNVWDGAKMLVKAYGFGPLEPNTFLLGDTQNPEDFANYAQLIQTIYYQGKNVVIVREGEDTANVGHGGEIDVWLGNQKQNAGLMLALAYMLNTSPEWNNSRLNLKTIVKSEDEAIGAEEQLKNFLQGCRVKSSIAAIVQDDEDSFQIIEKQSRKADIVFIGLRAPSEDETAEHYGAYYEKLIKKTAHMPPTAIVLAVEAVEFRRIFSSQS